MISAVAARKARLQSSTAAEPVAGPSTLQENLPSPPPSSRTPSKRKPSQQKPSESSRKRQRKSRLRGAEKRERYFVGADHDVAMLDENGNGDVSSVESVAGGEEEDILPGPSSIPISAPVSRKRAWSPSRPLVDSSDEDVSADEHIEESTQLPDTLDQEAALKGRAFIPVSDQNTFSLSSEEVTALHLPSTSPGIILILRPGEPRVSLLGTFTISVLRGSISILGAQLSASQHSWPVFAPRSSPVPVIQALPSDNLPSSSASRVPERIMQAVGERDVLVCVQEMKTEVGGLGQVVGSFAGVFEPSRRGEADVHTLPLDGVHIISEETRDIQIFHQPTCWTNSISSMVSAISDETSLSASAAPKILIRGPKNSGKSTFARTLVNSLLTRYKRVMFLECDLGQSEFTPGGMVALTLLAQPIFGPPFTHPTLPLAAHYVGAASPRSSPSHYLKSIEALIGTYEDANATTILTDEHADDPDARIADSIPLVVNTMGWTKGLGADLNRRIEEAINPTDIVEFEAPTWDPQQQYWPAAPAPALAPAAPLGARAPRLHVLPPVAPAPVLARWTAADHRALALLSYFHALFPAAGSPPHASARTTGWRTARPLCAVPPYELDPRAALDAVCLTGAGAEDVVPAEMGRVLNGAVVGVVSSLDSVSEGRGGVGPFRYTQGAPLPDPASSNCLGLALVRAVSPVVWSDGEDLRLHVLTPVPPRALQDGRVLVKGELELPVWGMLDFRTGDAGGVAGVERGKVPFLRWGRGEGVGAEVRRVRRNLMRRGQV